MLGSAMLEVAIGIIFVFLLVSIICSAIREGIEAWLKSRAAYLEYGVRELLHDRTGLGLAANFYQHPLIYSLYSDEYTPGKPAKRLGWLARGGKLPSYIPSRNFALALMDIAARGPDTDAQASTADAPVATLQAVRDGIKNLENPVVQRVLLSAIDSARGDFDKAQAAIEAWYDSAMDRVSGWYKRSTQRVLFFIALMVAIGLNINTIIIADYLYRNDAARAALVAKADTAASDPKFLEQTYDEVKKELEDVNLPIGWTAGWGAPRASGEATTIEPWNDVFLPLLGWLLTALAATMGAPFWFDVLNKVMVIRSTVKPHEKSPEEASEDRQPKRTEAPDTRGAAPQTSTVSSAVNAPAKAGTAPRVDSERDVDACYVDFKSNPTADEELPAAEGGIAR